MPEAIENINDTRRRLTFTLPGSGVDTEIETRLKSLQKTTMLPGFRKGKAPLQIIESRYRSGVKKEVLQDLSSLHLDQVFLKDPVPIFSGPYVENISNDSSGDYEISVGFEVIPEFSKLDISGESIEIPELVMSEADYERRYVELREYFHDWEQVDRQPQEGDYVTLSWESASEPDSNLDNPENRFPVRVGEQEPAELQEALLTLEVGKIHHIELAAPALASESADESQPPAKEQFKMRMESVAMPLKDRFAKKSLVDLFGVESEDDERLPEALRLFVRREVNAVTYKAKETQVRKLLLATNEFALPETAVALTFAEYLMDQGVEKDRALPMAFQKDYDNDMLRELKQVLHENLKFTWIIQKIAMNLELTTAEQDEVVEAKMREEARDFLDPEQAYNKMLPVSKQLIEFCMTRHVVDSLIEDASRQTMPMNYWDFKEWAKNYIEPESNTPLNLIPKEESIDELEPAESVIVDTAGNPISI